MNDFALGYIRGIQYALDLLSRELEIGIPVGEIMRALYRVFIEPCGLPPPAYIPPNPPGYGEHSSDSESEAELQRDETQEDVPSPFGISWARLRQK